MADNQSGRSREAGDRNRDQRQRARRITERMDRWAAEDDDRRARPHRRSRQARRVRGR